MSKTVRYRKDPDAAKPRNPILEACMKRYGNTTTVIQPRSTKRTKNPKRSWENEDDSHQDE